jgi:negative regulator of replication initiation
MSPHIELDEEIFDFLKTKAEPFVDTPNTVLRRLLGLDSAASRPANVVVTANPSVDTPTSRGTKATKKTAKSAKPKRTRAAAGTLLPEERYELPLLKALADAGGLAPYRDVVDAVGRELKDDLLPADFENLNSGAVRWQSRLQFVRLRLIERGYLDKNAPRGVWAITDAGRSALAEGERS